MENMQPENWNEDRYKELNTYFRIKIEQLLRTNTALQEKIAEAWNVQLSDLVDHMENEDQQLWEEFLVLDKQKLEIDMWNHLHGTGTRYRPGFGFTSASDTEW
ncbi:hypothetical protein [Botryobacter ruber]|uniref:hypothetical protein n=1 Tax=Botryobacter ruber TaxID=2171629 RepID=UPI000E0A4FEB|nr:hypothetical protein [Botryobacter ruber]